MKPKIPRIDYASSSKRADSTDSLWLSQAIRPNRP